jgi:hypothetical protein
MILVTQIVLIETITHMKNPIKRTALLLCLTACYYAAFSQVNKGQWLLGGNASFQHEQMIIADDLRFSSSRISTPVSAGYFIADKLAVGIRPSISRTSTQTQYKESGTWKSNSENVNLSKGAGIFTRYYILPKTSRVNFIIDGSYTLSHTKSSYIMQMASGTPVLLRESTTELYSNDYQLSMGPSIFLNKSVALELLAGYNFSDKLKSNVSSHTMFFGAGLQFHLGNGKNNMK